MPPELFSHTVAAVARMSAAFAANPLRARRHTDPGREAHTIRPVPLPESANDSVVPRGQVWEHGAKPPPSHSCHTAPNATHSPIVAEPIGALRRPMPLRVVRVIEDGYSQASAGRITISGRMADVCAELDRLVALQQGQFASQAGNALTH